MTGLRTARRVGGWRATSILRCKRGPNEAPVDRPSANLSLRPDTRVMPLCAEHDAGHGRMDHGLAGFGQALVVPRQPARARQPREGPLLDLVETWHGGRSRRGRRQRCWSRLSNGSRSTAPPWSRWWASWRSPSSPAGDGDRAPRPGFRGDILIGSHETGRAGAPGVGQPRGRTARGGDGGLVHAADRAEHRYAAGGLRPVRVTAVIEFLARRLSAAP